MMHGKIILQNYFRIQKGTKNVRNPHILRTLLILHFIDVWNFFWDIVWLRYCLNEFITFKGCSNDTRKNQNPKILKISKGMKNVRNFLPILHFFELLKNFGHFIWLEYCLNEFIKGCSNDSQKNHISKILKN